MSWTLAAVVIVSGGLGAFGRYVISGFMNQWLGEGFPYGTFSVNVLGSFLMGFLVALMMTRWSVSESTRLFLTTGFLGGFTTFSTFSLDAVVLIEQKNILLAAFYIGASVVVSIIALLIGMWVARQGVS